MLCVKCGAVNFQFLQDLPIEQRRQVRSILLADGHAEDHYYYVLHDTFADLLNSVRRGCQLCAMIYKAFTSPPPWLMSEALVKSIEIRQTKPIVMETGSSGERLSWAYHVTHHAFTPTRITITYGSRALDFDLLSDLPEPLARPGRDLGAALYKRGTVEEDSGTGSEASMALIRTWLADCDKNHSKCHIISAPMPKRVIYVGDTARSASLQVIEPQLGQRDNYIALSHCWGDPSGFAATQSWVADRFRLQSLSRWPRTFRDAVHIARRLYIPYLWIDIACIRQNDEDDFAQESAKMAEYFRNATLVVAAAHAADSRAGCFALRDPLLTRPCPIGFKKSRLLSQEGLIYYLALVPRISRTAGTSPLQSRAWAFQETLLSRRRVIFQQEQLQWSCLVHTASESSPKGVKPVDQIQDRIPLTVLRVFLHELSPYPWSRQDSDPRSAARQRLSLQDYYVNQDELSLPRRFRRNPAYQKWYVCVAGFSKCKITFRRDVLPAISGLATQISYCIGTDDLYLAGLWRGDLIRGLLWAVFDHVGIERVEGGKIKDLEYVGPSWSWVSRFGQSISYGFDESIMFGLRNGRTPRMQELKDALSLRDLSANLTLRNVSAIYGQVESGSLRFWARLLRGGRIGGYLGSRSIYATPHPASDGGGHGNGERQKIQNWTLTVPAFPVTESQTGSLAEADGIPAKSTSRAMEGEIAVDSYHLGHLLGRRKPLAEDDEIVVLLLWPYQFKGDRCLGLALAKTEGSQLHYRRVGRVDILIQHSILGRWHARLEEVIIT